MSDLIALQFDSQSCEQFLSQLSSACQKFFWVQLFPSSFKEALIPKKSLPEGSGIIVSSGGSIGGRKYSLIPYDHLDQSACATGKWLKEQGIETGKCLIFNPLPLHHVSGLMPWWRSRCWGTEHIWLEPSLLRDPIALERFTRDLRKNSSRPVVLSLVPTQLKRLLKDSVGVRWLKECSVIWVGGGGLSPEIAEAARSEGLPLSPCYGATETAAMVAALPPKDFLAGIGGCGAPLNDVELRLNADRRLAVRTPRLAIARWSGSSLEALVDEEGWWRSGDIAELQMNSQSCNLSLTILGRIDSAINCGGETVFPEQLEARLIEAAVDLPLQSVLFLPVNDPDWGQRLVALIRFREMAEDRISLKLLIELKRLVGNWLPAEKPVKWYLCPDLSVNDLGKWERSRWANWLELNLYSSD